MEMPNNWINLRGIMLNVEPWSIGFGSPWLNQYTLIIQWSIVLHILHLHVFWEECYEWYLSRQLVAVRARILFIYGQLYDLHEKVSESVKASLMAYLVIFYNYSCSYNVIQAWILANWANTSNQNGAPVASLCFFESFKGPIFAQQVALQMPPMTYSILPLSNP